MERLSKMGKSLKNFTYDNKEIADEIYAAVNSTQFLGVSVRTHSNLRCDFSRSFLLFNVEIVFVFRRVTSRLARRATELL